MVHPLMAEPEVVVAREMSATSPALPVMVVTDTAAAEPADETGQEFPPTFGLPPEMGPVRTVAASMECRTVVTESAVRRMRELEAARDTHSEKVEMDIVPAG